RMLTIPVETREREQLIDITSEVAKLARDIDEGVVWLHCPHTTAALTIQENADPALRVDYLEHLAKLVPQPGFRHDEGNADAHIKSSLIGTTQPVLVDKGKLVLGRWQAIYFVELDGPRRRQVMARVSKA
ncbi:MAG TPA: secondary thiamine-phosphate synthase enzyme YjbQ, partial [Polyangiaceae bacterium]|nr:secondary thiamine-phosphate synthase enzyme YjbQ [Polyangiaceae bacterium]